MTGTMRTIFVWAWKVIQCQALLRVSHMLGMCTSSFCYVLYPSHIQLSGHNANTFTMLLTSMLTYVILQRKPNYLPDNFPSQQLIYLHIHLSTVILSLFPLSILLSIFPFVDPHFFQNDLQISLHGNPKSLLQYFFISQSSPEKEYTFYKAYVIVYNTMHIYLFIYLF